MECDIFLNAYHNDDNYDNDTANIIAINVHRLLTKVFVDQAFGAFFGAGFSGDVTSSRGATSPPNPRSRQEVAADVANHDSGTSDAAAALVMTPQEAAFVDSTAHRAESLSKAQLTAQTPQQTVSACQSDRTVLEPYLLRLRDASAAGLSSTDRLALNNRRDAPNTAVALSDLGPKAAS